MAKAVNVERVERDWKERGFSFGVWTDPPGTAWENYVHGVDELFMVVEGDMELEMRGSRQKAAVGDEILIPAGVPHSVRNTGLSAARWLYG